MTAIQHHNMQVIDLTKLEDLQDVGRAGQASFMTLLFDCLGFLHNLDRVMQQPVRKEINEPLSVNLTHAEDLNELFKSSRQYGKDFKHLYVLLKQTFPSGLVHREQFLQLFAAIFPHAVSLAFANRMFDVFATRDEEHVQLLRIMAALSKLYYGTLKDKIQWIFQFYDSNNDNFLNESDVLNTVTSIYALNGIDASSDSSRNLICQQTRRLLLVSSAYIVVDIVLPNISHLEFRRL
ncbi:kv channel interacting protein 1 [Trichuris trichiura]|uniref:Kv channel interacting protein 1 n=1 Tax=Trichuris trichiura TaxID=36087 RepID=A0A077Z2Y3_TRITR|nr:kv channel interacting protein 1 [Trichuris trichiura]